MRDAVLSLLRERHGAKAALLSIERLAGDASDRRYHRVTADGLPSYVLMEIVRLESSLKSEEVTLYHDTRGELPFLNIRRFLAGLGLPVPEAYAYDRARGLLLLEDLGPTLLFDVVQERGAAGAEDLYRGAVELLVEMQARATAGAPGAADCMAFRQRFEPALLVWEFDHFLEYGLEKKGLVLAPEDRTAIRASFAGIAAEIAAAPTVFTHRDYHSRNLLVRGAGLSIIDFQDALLGPPSYDLASLLRDSYVALPEEMIDGLVALYLDLARRARIPGTEDPAAFRRLFDLTCIQRNLKAAGRFDYIAMVKGNPKFLPFIPPTLGYVRRNLARYPELATLRERLARYVPALGADA